MPFRKTLKHRLKTYKKTKTNKKLTNRRKSYPSTTGHGQCRQGKKKGIKIITAPQIMTDAEIAAKEGLFFERGHYHEVIGGEDCDIYGTKLDGTKILLAKLRTGVLGPKECRAAFQALEPFARKTWNVNRGAAAGLVSLRRLPKYVGEVVQKKEGGFRLYYRGKDGKLRQDNISNRVRSNIIGFYDQPDRNKLAGGKKAPKVPCRMTAWTRDHPREWHEAIIPLVQQIDRQFAQLLPDRHQVQLSRANRTPDFQIPETAFSTMTVNYNYQSANHKDAGDLDEGFGNLIVLERDQCVKDSISSSGAATRYEGGLLGFPQYGVALDIRQGDFCAVNVHEWHSNTKIVGPETNNNLAQQLKDEKQTQATLGLETWGRMTLVCYLRKGMLDKCKT
jgi:hypothetical protein